MVPGQHPAFGAESAAQRLERRHRHDAIGRRGDDEHGDAPGAQLGELVAEIGPSGERADVPQGAGVADQVGEEVFAHAGHDPEAVRRSELAGE